jgi:hypothetical protein
VGGKGKKRRKGDERIHVVVEEATVGVELIREYKLHLCASGERE